MRSIKPLMKAAIIFAIPLGLSIQSFQSCSSGYLPLSGPNQEVRNEDSEPPTPTLPPPNDKSFYYPPVSNSEKEACDSSTWEYTSSLSAGFNEEKLNEVMNFIKEPSQHTTAFVILHQGRIVREWYSGKIDLSDYNSGLTQGLLRVANWDCSSADRIHSASKSVVSVAIGIAEQEGRLKLEDPVSQFLGSWTNLSAIDEDKIRIKHLLSMTSGLDGAPAGGRWL
ncbi:MAG: serine hydrolase [Bdellovibrionales bacterium]|nr:serine hydrolase [Bdellovibrionales bacterium]